MSSLTRDDRLERQNLDDGDPEDTVFTGRHAPGNSGEHIYHDDPDCNRIRQDELKEWTRREAKLHWKAPGLCCVVDGSEEGV